MSQLAKRRLGRTELMVTSLGLGGMGFMLHQDPGEDRTAVIQSALKHGINFFDTARGYYDSEKVLGEAIEHCRKDCIIATKSFIRSQKGMEKEILTSLKNLRTDYIDLYQVHHVQYEYELEQILKPDGAMAALLEYKKQGAIGFLGVTSHRPEMMIQCIETDLFDTIQLPLNPIERKSAMKIIDKALEHDMGIIIMKPLAGGNLKNIDAALKFALSHKISVVIPGCSSPEEVEMDVTICASTTPLSGEELEVLHKEIENLDEQFCRRCRYCEVVCPQNIKLSEIFRCENYLILNATFARDEYRRLEKKSTDCIECGKCEDRCPYQLPTRDMLKRAHKRLTRGKFEDIVVKTLRRLNLYDVVRKLYFAIGGKIPKR